MWPEIHKAQDENRRELVLQGKNLSERIRSSSDPRLEFNHIFRLSSLNFLEIRHVPEICEFPLDGLKQLTQLTTLILSGNAISKLPSPVTTFKPLTKLKVLDLSENVLAEIPEDFPESIPSVTTLNLSLNRISEIPDMSGCTNLTSIHLIGNSVSNLDFLMRNESLMEIYASKNKIESISSEISSLTHLKKMELEDNYITTIPREIIQCVKLKDLKLKGNPLKENRLKKLVDQKGTKAVLDFIERSKPDPTESSKTPAASKKKLKPGEKVVHQYCLKVQRVVDVQIIQQDDKVKSVRPFLYACVVRELDLKTPGNLKKFLGLQTRLHDGICKKRTVATIATHDLSKLNGSELIFTTLPKSDMKLIPLGRTCEIKASDFIQALIDEAENMRKELKRNSFSGIHQYLSLVKNLDEYPCLLNSNEIISFPPITNANSTRLSCETDSILIEITGVKSASLIKSVADTLLLEMVKNGLSSDPKVLHVEQVKIVDSDGNLKTVYPSKADLHFENVTNVQVERL